MGTCSLTSPASDGIPSLSLLIQYRKFLCSSVLCVRHSAESAHVFSISIFPYILLLHTVLYVGSFIWSPEMLWKFKYIRLCYSFVIIKASTTRRYAVGTICDGSNACIQCSYTRERARRRRLYVFN